MRKTARLQLECLETREVLNATSLHSLLPLPPSASSPAPAVVGAAHVESGVPTTTTSSKTTSSQSLTPVVTYGGGGVLPSVQVEGLYLGSQWYSNSTLYQQTGYFEGFLGNVVNSSYMDMLNQAGYGVGRGSATTGSIDLMKLGSSVSDSQIQGQLHTFINDGYLSTPDSNRLYMVFVPPNVEVTTSFGNSVKNFAGYHSAFNMTTASGQTVTIHYAVIDTPGGSIGNGSANPNLSALNEMTTVATHELTEAVTDPNPGTGWVDRHNGEEVGDLANGIAVTLNGYKVQAEVNQYGQVIYPAGSTNLVLP
jgi:hypothetical protein